MMLIRHISSLGMGLCLILSLSLTLPVFSQDFEEQDYTKSKKAWSFMEKARKAFEEKQLNDALGFALKSIREDSNFVLPYIISADIHSDLQEWDAAVKYYRKAVSIDPDFDPFIWFVYANAEFNREEYRKARQLYEVYLENAELDPIQDARVRKLMNTCLFRARSLENPFDISPLRLGGGINTDADEYVNTVGTDQRELIFTRKETDSLRSGLFRERVFISVKEDSLWMKAAEMDVFLNEFGNIGAATFSPDGQYLFFTGCNAPGGYGSCDLYYTRRRGRGWTLPANLGPVVNTSTWESQPCLSSDGRTLYFASRRPGGKGSSDIWTSSLQSDGSWSRPVNMGDLVNSQDAEMAPFIHQDGKTLYFSSKGHTGMGGYDLFVCRKDENDIWSAPRNLGYPINSGSDEINLIVSADGQTGYISSGNYGETGRYDIFRIDIPEEFRPLPVTYLQGLVYDAKTMDKLEASFELIALNSGKVIVRSVSNPLTGEFLLCLPSDREYALNVSKPEYLFYSDHFNLNRMMQNQGEPFRIDVPLMPIEPGSKVILKNIFFDHDNYQLKEESYTELEKLLDFLRQNPEIRIEIGGHTDNTGSFEYNKSLSENRARAVYLYLIEKGINDNRLNYMGYSYSNPVASNDTEEGRALNRRTEFIILDY
ncbi:MAG: OmpA family protein [Bacteroidetes bacterium]|nr:OmpA family protein [Bacteroidota bacterium]